MDDTTVLLLVAVVLVVGLWYVLNIRMDDIETDIKTLGRATGREDLLTTTHKTQN